MVVIIQGADLKLSVSIKAARRELDENLAAFKWLITYAVPPVDDPISATSTSPGPVGVQPDVADLHRLFYESKHNFLAKTRPRSTSMRATQSRLSCNSTISRRATSRGPHISSTSTFSVGRPRRNPHVTMITFWLAS
jgi:hypothetical protein